MCREQLGKKDQLWHLAQTPRPCQSLPSGGGTKLTYPTSWFGQRSINSALQPVIKNPDDAPPCQQREVRLKGVGWGRGRRVINCCFIMFSSDMTLAGPGLSRLAEDTPGVEPLARRLNQELWTPIRLFYFGPFLCDSSTGDITQTQTHIAPEQPTLSRFVLPCLYVAVLCRKHFFFFNASHLSLLHIIVTWQSGSNGIVSSAHAPPLKVPVLWDGGF